MTWDLSCPDWEARLAAGLAPIRDDFPIDASGGDRAVAVFNKLRLADVPDTPAMAEAGGDWFKAVVRVLFGSMDPITRERAIRELFILVPKKNSKTTNGALLMVTALLLNQRPNAPFIMTAPVQDVAEIAFDAAAGAISLDAVLSKKLHIRQHLKTIVHRETKAELQIMTFDPSVLTGQKCAGVLIDELHVSAKLPKASSAIRQLRGGMLPFPEAFLAFITTQSEDPPTGAFKAELAKARAIRDGRQSGSMLPVLYELPERVQKDREAWRDPKLWASVTPNAGRSITIDRLREEFHTAVAAGEDELRGWASQHLNLEIGLALRSDRWVGADFWEGAMQLVTLDRILAECEVVDVGVDGGGLDDLLGMAVIGRCRTTKRWLLWTHAWCQPEVLLLRKDIASKLEDLRDAGDLTICEHPTQDVEEFVDIVERLKDAGLLPEKEAIGLDPAGVAAIIDALVDRGVTDEQLMGVPQGYRLNGAVLGTERKVGDGTFRHGGQALMTWCVGNAKTERRGNAVLITKQVSGVAKIDPLIATFNAFALMTRNPEGQGRSFWEAPEVAAA